MLWRHDQELCLLAKRLDWGRFVWPRTKGEAVTITAALVGFLLERVDRRLPQWPWRTQVEG